MRALTYLVATTLDGFIAEPDGADPSSLWPVTPDYVEHLTEHYPETLPGQARAALGIEGRGRQFDTVIEGRRSYEVGLAAGVADAYPHLRHLVVSTTLGATADPAVELVSRDPADINPVLRGWGNYFRTGNAAQKFRQIDDYVVGRLRRLMIKKRGRNLRPGQWLEWTEDWFNGHGLYRLRGTVRYPKAA